MEKKSKIYIAGHRGMVGSSILRKFKDEGHTNIVVRSHNELDLTNQMQVINFFEVEKPDYVILAAAKVGGILANNTYRAQFIYENLMIANNVIHQSYLSGVKKLVFLGSSCIYPKLAPQPIREESLLSSALEDTNEPYALAKIAGLKMCENYHRQYGCNFFSVMPSNLYGPNDSFNLRQSHVLSGLMRKMHLAMCIEQQNWKAISKDLNHHPIDGIDGNASKDDILKALDNNGIHSGDEITVDVWGTGKVLREFLYVDDLADAVWFLIKKYDLPEKVENVSNPNYFFNIGSGEDLTVNELAKKVQKAVGFNGNLSNDLSRPDGTPRKLLDVGLMKKLGWEYKTKLDTGIDLMYKWYLESLS